MRESFGQLLRAHRLALRMQRRRANAVATWSMQVPLSQNELARRAGIDPAYVNRLEAGRPATRRGRPQVPAREIVLALAVQLKLDAAETDRFLQAAGLAPEIDWQTRAEAAEAKLDLIRQAFELPADLLTFPSRALGKAKGRPTG